MQLKTQRHLSSNKFPRFQRNKIGEKCQRKI
jgi:hypothetical protein